MWFPITNDYLKTSPGFNYTGFHTTYLGASHCIAPDWKHSFRKVAKQLSFCNSSTVALTPEKAKELTAVLISVSKWDPISLVDRYSQDHQIYLEFSSRLHKARLTALSKTDVFHRYFIDLPFSNFCKSRTLCYYEYCSKLAFKGWESGWRKHISIHSPYATCYPKRWINQNMNFFDSLEGLVNPSSFPLNLDFSRRDIFLILSSIFTTCLPNSTATPIHQVNYCCPPSPKSIHSQLSNWSCHTPK